MADPPSGSSGGVDEGGGGTSAFQSYLLSRLGLLPDEARWPDAAGDMPHNDGLASSSSAWRARDPLASLLGTDAVVDSDSGTTPLEDLGNNGGSGKGNSEGKGVEGELVSIASILDPLLPSTKPSKIAAGEGKDEGRGRQLDGDVVRRALDAAALAVVRGNRRSLEAAAAAGSKGDKAAATSTGDTKEGDVKPHPEDGKANNQNGYHPPLVHAAEAIRRAKMASLDAGRTAGSTSLPQFLKKHNTIPWFHVPLQPRGGGGGGSGGAGGGSGSGGAVVAGGGVAGSTGSKGAVVPDKAKSASAAPDKMKSTAAAGKKESNAPPDGKKKKREGSGGGDIIKKAKKEAADRGSKKRSGGDVATDKAAGSKETPQGKRPKLEDDDDEDTLHPSAKIVGKAAKKEAQGDAKAKDAKATPASKKRTRSKILTPASSSKPPILSPSTPDAASTGTRRKKSTTVRTPASVEDATGIPGPAASARAVIGAAAAGIFRDLDPDRKEVGNNKVVTDDESTAAKGEVANINAIAAAATASAHAKKKKAERVDVGTVLSHAKKLGNGVGDKARGAARRGDQRREFRMDGAWASGAVTNPFLGRREEDKEEEEGEGFVVKPVHSLPLVMPHVFLNANPDAGDDNAANGAADAGTMDIDPPRQEAMAPDDPEWTRSCLPRLLSILDAGAGHAVLHDRRWEGRASRIAALLRRLAVPRGSTTRSDGDNDASSSSTRGYPNYGPHLVVTAAGEDFEMFRTAFGRLGEGLQGVVAKVDANDNEDGHGRCSFPTDPDDVLLRALPYHGPKAHRRQLRKHFGSLVPPSNAHGAFLAGMPDAPFHVVVTTYTALVEDYAHFCQIPFQAVVCDDGMGWLGCAGSDPTGKLGRVWNDGLWSRADDAAGGAGAATEGKQRDATPWDFGRDGKGGGERIGLTARHRVLLASLMRAQSKGQVHKAPVLGLLSFLAPQFAEAIKDDWERSRIFHCKKSLDYVRTVIARLIVVYSGDAVPRRPAELVALSLQALEGDSSPRVPGDVAAKDDEEWVDRLVQAQKVVHSRKYAASWFRPSAALRREVESMQLDPILAAVKKVHGKGYVCEEVVTSSSLTPAGVGGSVLGLSAYRAAVRCGRCFNSEQGLKQHVVSVHAPPGTWLCRYCGGDCGTSQARASHERTCGVQKGGSTQKLLRGSAATAGEGKKKGSKKKEAKNAQGDGSESKAVAEKVDDATANESEAQDAETNYTSDSSGAAMEYDDVMGEAADKVAVTTERGTVINFAPELAEIDIKKLPPHIKPLLRDPTWTPRTGGNSKRYVYAYRGVCRQQRKGHDRWQSQISCNGTNHYLGTFDSEWDAAACYAWAHLILYGEEATRKAQLEGEEAVAAFEKQQKDIADGKIPPPSPKSAKKKKVRSASKKAKAPSSKDTSNEKPTEEDKAESDDDAKGSAVVADVAPSSSSVHTKKKRPMSLKEWGKLKTECAMMLSSGTKGTSKASILTTKKDIADMNEKMLLHHISGLLSLASDSFLQSIQMPGRRFKLPPCVPLSRFAPTMPQSQSRALLIGLPAGAFGWQIETFIESCEAVNGWKAASSFLKLSVEFGVAGGNKSFRALLLSACCTMGRALKANDSSTLGMPVGNLDCNIGGPEHSCSEMAARIQFLPSKHSTYRFMACNDDDFVTLNGQRITASKGPLPLKDRDVCSVGARVFVFVEKIG